MSTVSIDYDPVQRLMENAHSLNALADALDEDRCGIAGLLRLVGKSVRECAEYFDDTQDERLYELIQPVGDTTTSEA